MIDVEETASAAAQVNDPSLNTDASEPSDTTTTESAETTAAAEQPKPGTPDKALQRMQQELGNAVREIAALKEQKADTGLTDAQKTKLAKAEQRVEKIRNYANRPDREEFPNDVDPVAEQVLDLTDRVSEVDQLKAALKEATSKIDYLMNDHGWEKARAKYSGLDVDAIWQKANKDATDDLGDVATPAAVNRIASKYFEQRCEAAKKRQGDVDPKKKDSPPPQQYRVGSGQGVPPKLSEADELIQEARSLTREI